MSNWIYETPILSHIEALRVKGTDFGCFGWGTRAEARPSAEVTGDEEIGNVEMTDRAIAHVKTVHREKQLRVSRLDLLQRAVFPFASIFITSCNDAA